MVLIKPSMLHFCLKLLHEIHLVVSCVISKTITEDFTHASITDQPFKIIHMGTGKLCVGCYILKCLT